MKILYTLLTYIFILQIPYTLGQNFSSETLITMPGNNYDFDILTSDVNSGDTETYISWVNQVDSLYTIYLKKLSPDLSRDIIVSSSSTKKLNPQICINRYALGIKIAWQDSIDGIWRVFLKNYDYDTLNTNILLIDSVKNNPQITMSTHNIAWIDNGYLKIKKFYNDIEESCLLDSINCSSPDLVKGDYLDYTKIVYIKRLLGKKEIYVAELNESISPDWEINNISKCEDNINPKYGFMMSVAYQGYKNGFWNIYYENFLNHLLDSIQIGGYNLKNPLVFCYDIPLSDYNPLTPYFVVFEKDSLLESESDIFLNTFGFILADSLIRISHNPGKNSEPEVAYLWESDTTKLAIIWINDNNGKKDLWIAKSVFIPYITSIKKNEKQFNFISIKQNYPNPFNPKTTIEYYLTRSAKTSITVYNVLGEIIKVFDEGFQTAGTHEITFNGENYPSGIYYYNIKSGSFSKTKSMVLLK